MSIGLIVLILLILILLGAYQLGVIAAIGATVPAAALD